jgi:hypothetical protein
MTPIPIPVITDIRHSIPNAVEGFLNRDETKYANGIQAQPNDINKEMNATENKVKTHQYISYAFKFYH